MAIIFANASKTPEVVRAVKANRMRKIASKIYTDDLTSPPEEVVRRHRLEIAAHFYPGALISHRSALEGNNISPGGKLHLTVSRAVATVRKLPGLEIRIWRGPAPQADDTRTPLGDGKELFTSSQARAILENMQIARAHGGGEPKTLSPEELERWIDRYLRIFGVGWLDKLREQANDLASRFGWLREQQELNQLVAAIKGETSSYRLTTDLLRSRAQARLIIPTSLRNDYLTVLEALTGNSNSAPFVAFAHKLTEVNSRMPFGSFEQSQAYFKHTGALDEQPQGFGFLPSMLEAKS